MNETHATFVGSSGPIPPRPQSSVGALVDALDAVGDAIPFDLAVGFLADGNGFVSCAARGKWAPSQPGLRVQWERVRDLLNLQAPQRPVLYPHVPPGVSGNLLSLPFEHSCLLVPLLSGTQLLGLLVFCRSASLPYPEQVAVWASSFGRTTALLLQMARDVEKNDRLDAHPPAASVRTPRADRDFPRFVENERAYLEHALSLTSGKLHGADGAAALVGLKPTTLQSKLKKLGIQARHWKMRRASGAVPSMQYD